MTSTNGNVLATRPICSACKSLSFIQFEPVEGIASQFLNIDQLHVSFRVANQSVLLALGWLGDESNWAEIWLLEVTDMINGLRGVQLDIAISLTTAGEEDRRIHLVVQDVMDRLHFWVDLSDQWDDLLLSS